MKVQSIDIAIRSSHDRAPRVRFERSTAIPAGTISMLVVGGDLVVSCGTRAIVDAVGSTVLDGDPGTVPELLLRDGALELAVCCRARESSEILTSPPQEPTVKGGAEAHGALAIRDAEWTPADDSEPASAPRLSNPPSRPAPAPRVIPLVVTSVQRDPADNSWDEPTRFHPVADPIPVRPSRVATPEPSDSKAPSPPAGGLSPRRKMIRRVALLSMLLCAFAIVMRTRRAREARPVKTASSHVAAAPPIPRDAPPPSARAPAQTAETSSPSATTVALDGIAAAASSGKPSSVTKARRAADALANGAYSDALPLYEELSAEGGPNAAAYGQAARILRTRNEQHGVTPP